MIPTNEFRWLKRTVNRKTIFSPSGKAYGGSYIDTVLQQKWVGTLWLSDDINPDEYEWRDIPVIEEPPV